MLTQTVIAVLEELLGAEMAGKTLGEFLYDFLDMDISVSEECLHLGVSTPVDPAGVKGNFFSKLHSHI